MVQCNGKHSKRRKRHEAAQSARRAQFTISRLRENVTLEKKALTLFRLSIGQPWC